jgi:hypothetical protein
MRKRHIRLFQIRLNNRKNVIFDISGDLSAVGAWPDIARRLLRRIENPFNP